MPNTLLPPPDFWTVRRLWYHLQIHFVFVDTYIIRKVKTNVFFRPILSATEPKMRDPIITPAKKRLVDNGESQVWSHISDHSDICNWKENQYKTFGSKFSQVSAIRSISIRFVAITIFLVKSQSSIFQKLLYFWGHWQKLRKPIRNGIWYRKPPNSQKGPSVSVDEKRWEIFTRECFMYCFFFNF